MKKFLSCLLVFALALALLAGCSSASSSQPASGAASDGAAPASGSDDVIKVGVCLVQSGPMGGIVDYLIPTVQMAFDDVNAAGGINGRQVEVIFRDDQGDTSMVAQRLNELKEEGCEVIIGPLLDTQAPAAAEWAGENKIPVILCCTMATDVSIENFNDYIFCTGPSAWAEARVLEKYVLENNIKSVYMVGSVGGVVEDNFGFFADEIADLDPEVEILATQMIQMTDSDFQSIISDIQAKKPDLVVFDSGAQATNFLQQGIQFDLFSSVKTFGFDFLAPSVTEGFGSDFPTTISSVTWVPAFCGTDAMNTYVEKLQGVTNGLYPMSLTIQCHNGALAAIAALEACGDNISTDSIASALETVSFASPIGECSFRAFDHQLIFPLAYSDAIYDGVHEFAVEGNITYMDDSVWPTQEELEAYAATLG